MTSEGTDQRNELPQTAPQLEIDSGTGWPAGTTDSAHPSASDPWSSQTVAIAGSNPGRHDTVPLPGPTRSRPDDASGDDPDDEDKPRRKGVVGRVGSRLFWLAMVAGVLVILLIGTNLAGLWPHLSNPFAARKIDRSQPTLLLSIQDLARFEAASGNFQVIIDVQEDRRFIPDIIFSERSLFVAAGSVGAYVDFSNVGQGDVTTSTDRKTVNISLPAPQLDSPNLDLSKSYVYSEQRGLINRIGDLFGGDTNKQQELYLLAQQKIAAAAVDSQLAQRAADNTKQMLTQLLKSLGFTTINVQFASP